MREYATDLTLFDHSNFEQLLSRLKAGAGDIFHQELWFQMGVMHLWRLAGSPYFSAELQAKYFSKISKVSCYNSIFQGAYEVIEKKWLVDLDQGLHTKLVTLNQISLTLKHNQDFCLSEELFKKLVLIRIGSFPANIHPVFENITKSKYLNNRYINNLSGIKDQKGQDLFRYSETTGAFQVHANFDWDRLFGNGHMDIQEEITAASRLEENIVNEYTSRYLDKIQNVNGINNSLEQKLDDYILANSITSVDFKSRAIEYLQSMTEAPYRNHLLVALKRAIDNNQDIDAIIDYCFDGFTAYNSHVSSSCISGQQERIITIALTYGELPLNTLGKCKAQQKSFFDQYRKDLCNLILSKMSNALPVQLTRHQRWTEQSADQQSIVEQLVFSLLQLRYNNIQTAEYMLINLANGSQWLSMLMDYLKDPIVLNDDKITRLQDAEALFFSEMQSHMLNENNHSLLNIDVELIHENFMEKCLQSLNNVMHIGQDYSGLCIFDLTANEVNEWRKVEGFSLESCLEDVTQNKLINNDAFHLLERHHLEALDADTIKRIASYQPHKILDIISNIQTASNDDLHLILIDMLIHYMVTNKDKKLLVITAPYLHRLSKISFDVDPFHNNTLFIEGEQITRRIIGGTRASYMLKKNEEAENLMRDCLYQKYATYHSSMSDYNTIRCTPLVIAMNNEDHTRVMNILSFFKTQSELLKRMLVFKNAKNETPLWFSIAQNNHKMTQLILNIVKQDSKLLNRMLICPREDKENPFEMCLLNKNIEAAISLIEALKDDPDTIKEMLEWDKKRYIVLTWSTSPRLQPVAKCIIKMSKYHQWIGQRIMSNIMQWKKHGDFKIASNGLLRYLLKTVQDDAMALKQLLDLENSKRQTLFQIAQINLDNDLARWILDAAKIHPEILRNSVLLKGGKSAFNTTLTNANPLLVTYILQILNNNATLKHELLSMIDFNLIETLTLNDPKCIQTLIDHALADRSPKKMINALFNKTMSQPMNYLTVIEQLNHHIPKEYRPLLKENGWKIAELILQTYNRTCTKQIIVDHLKKLINEAKHEINQLTEEELTTILYELVYFSSEDIIDLAVELLPPIELARMPQRENESKTNHDDFLNRIDACLTSVKISNNLWQQEMELSPQQDVCLALSR